MIRTGNFVVLLALLVASSCFAQQPIAIAPVTRQEPVDFEREILPIFRANCLACHSATERQGGLVLESAASIAKGSDSGAAVVAGKSAESLLLKLAAHQDEPAMPPPNNDVAARPLTPQQLGLLKLWIDQGAKGAGPGNVLSPTAWRPLPPGNHPIYAAAVTPDGQFAACSRANQIFVYHVPTGRLVAKLNDPALQAASADRRLGMADVDVIQSLAFSKQGDVLASGGFRTVKLWRYPRDVQRLALAAAPAANDAISAVAVSPDQKLLATAAGDFGIQLWNAETGAAVQSLAGHTGAVNRLKFSHDGVLLYSAAADQSIRVWRIADGQLVGRIDTPTALAALETLVQKSPLPAAPQEAAANGEPSDGSAAATEAEPRFTIVEQLATGGGDNFIRLWDPRESLPQPLAAVPQNANVLAVSPDGKTLALANPAGAVSVLAVDTNELIQTWAAHSGAIHALALGPVVAAAAEAAEAAADPPAANVPQLATAGADGAVRLWHRETGEALGVLRGTLGAVASLAFTPDGKQLVAGYADGQVTVWNVEVIAPRSLTEEKGSPAMHAILSPDGKLLAVATTTNDKPAIVVRDMASGKVLHALLGHADTITSLAFNGDATKIVSGSADRTARVWLLADDKFPEIARLAGHAGAVTAVAFNTDATQVVTGAADNSVKLWNASDEQELHHLGGHSGAIVAVAMTPQGQIVSASADKTIRFWNPADGQTVRTITDPAALSSLALNRDGTRLAVAAADKNIRIYNQTDGALVATLAGHSQPATSLSFSLDNTRLLSAGGDNQALVWNVAEGRLLEIAVVEQGLTAATFASTAHEVLLADVQGGIHITQLQFAQSLPGMQDRVTSVAVRADGQMIFTACAAGAVRGYTIADGQQAFAANHGAAVHDVALSADGQRLASAGEDRVVKLWNAANGAPLAPPQLSGFLGPVHRVAFTPDNSRTIGGSAQGEVLVFDASGALEESLTGHTATVSALRVLSAVNEGETQVISLSADGIALRWRPHGIGRLAGHTQPVTALASLPVPEGQPLQLLSGGLDGIVQRWNVATRQSLGQLNHGGPVTSVAARADGQRLASTSSNHSVRLWNAANNALVLEMRGDIRADANVARLTQEKAATTAKINARKAEVTAAEQDLPVKTQVVAAATTALTAARADVAAKAAALTQATAAKSAAEEAAIRMAATAVQTAKVMENANQLALTLMAEAQLLLEKAAAAQTAAQAQPENAALAQAYATAMQVAAAADAKAKAADAAKAAPTQAAATASQNAASAATAAQATVQPFQAASVALATSQAALAAAEQAEAIAQRDLKLATERIPAAQENVAKAEALLAKLDAELTAATAVALAAQQPLAAAAFSPDGRALATGGADGVVHTWDAETGKAMGSFVGHSGPIRALAFAGSDELFSGGSDKSAIVWRLHPEWRLERVIGRIDDPATLVDRVMGLSFSPDGQRIAAVGGVPSRTGEVKVFSTVDGSLVRSCADVHTDEVNAVAFSADGEFLATGSADKYVRMFSVATGEQMRQFEGHTGHVLGVAWRADGSQLVSSGADQCINTWNAASGDRISKIEGYNKQVTAVRYVGQTQFFLAISGDPFVRMHNGDNGGVQRNYGGAGDYLYALDVTPNAENGVVVAGGHDGVLRIWNTANAQLLHELAAPVEPTETSTPPAPAAATP